MVTLYNVISEDGFIARKDGSEDFIPDDYWPHTLDILRTYDRIVLGRKTYETLQNYEKELRVPFDNLPVQKFVISKDAGISVKDGYTLVSSPEEALNPTMNIVVISGPTLNNYLIQHNLVNRIMHHEVPVSIGEGIKPYNDSEGIEVTTL